MQKIKVIDNCPVVLKSIFIVMRYYCKPFNTYYTKKDRVSQAKAKMK